MQRWHNYKNVGLNYVSSNSVFVTLAATVYPIPIHPVWNVCVIVISVYMHIILAHLVLHI